MKITIKLANAVSSFVATSVLIAAGACGSDNKTTPDTPAQADAAIQAATLKLANSATLGNYLTDGSGKTLYLYSKDFPATSGATATAAVSNCTSAQCLAAWPVFHAETVTLGTGLTAGDFGEITRADSTKQTTFRGWPLYYYAMDTAAGDTKGDKVNNVWYVLRDPNYSLLVMSVPTPVAGGPTLYLSTPGGMTLYYFTNDTPGTSTTPPVSACNGGCLTAWPAFLAQGTVFPTVVVAADFTTFDRGGGVQQSAYKGHPLYLFATDSKPGDTKGDKANNVWFVVNPTTLQ
jgi:predicted lipoprotein with Yx(FWY)xxD motif